MKQHAAQKPKNEALEGSGRGLEKLKEIKQSTDAAQPAAPHRANPAIYFLFECLFKLRS